MRLVAAAALTFLLDAAAQNITITRSGSQPPRPAPAENFTGSVRIDSSFQGVAPARIYGARVAFEAGARTAWHTHPLGQTLLVTAGTGRVQRWGDPVHEIRQGDIVWIPPGQKHWHGAGPAHFDDSHRHRGTIGWKVHGLDGKGHRCAVLSPARRCATPTRRSQSATRSRAAHSRATPDGRSRAQARRTDRPRPLR